MEQQYKYLMWCIVPGCKSTTAKTPNKPFFRVPVDEKRRKLWINAVRRNYSDFCKSSSLFVCEDHFHVQEDMENYTKFKLMGGQKKLKPDVVPHIFACQPDRKRAAPRSPRKTSTKRSHNQEIDEILSGALSSTSNTGTHNMQNELLNSDESNTSTSSLINTASQTDSPPKKYFRSKNTQCYPSTRSVACMAFSVTIDCSTSTSELEAKKTTSKRLIFADLAATVIMSLTKQKP